MPPLPKPKPEIPINTLNEHILMSGENMPNHSTSLAGLGKFIKVGSQHPYGLTFRTKQSVYRFCAYALLMVFILPDEEGNHSFEDVLEAIKNT